MADLLPILLLLGTGAFLGWTVRDTQADIEDNRRWDKGCRCDYRKDTDVG